MGGGHRAIANGRLKTQLLRQSPQQANNSLQKQRVSIPGMGKLIKHSGAMPKVKTRSVSTFFSPQSESSSSGPKNAAKSKKAKGTEALNTKGIAITREEFFDTLQNLEKNMAAITANLIKPLAEQFGDFQKSLRWPRQQTLHWKQALLRKKKPNSS